MSLCLHEWHRFECIHFKNWCILSAHCFFAMANLLYAFVNRFDTSCAFFLLYTLPVHFFPKHLLFFSFVNYFWQFLTTKRFLLTNEKRQKIEEKVPKKDLIKNHKQKLCMRFASCVMQSRTHNLIFLFLFRKPQIKYNLLLRWD